MDTLRCSKCSPWQNTASRRKPCPSSVASNRNHVRSVKCQAVTRKRKQDTAARTQPTAPDDEDARTTDLTPAPYQQTLNRSFTLAGLGLHTGEQACVRVCPAFAGDGKYFVRVPEGTNIGKVDEEQSLRESAIKQATQADPALEARQVGYFMQYSQAVENGFPASFEDFLKEVGAEEDAGMVAIPPISAAEEEPVAKPTDGSALDAVVGNLAGISPFYTVLGEDEQRVMSVEHLLGALEGLHVDNARIEIEGGDEVPILDGSAQGWVENVAHVGVRPAFEEGSDEMVRKHAWRPLHPITVFDHESFIALYPAGLDYQISAGVFQQPEAIDQQWITFDAQGVKTPNTSFAFDIAPARTWLASTDAAYALREAGYLKAGTVGTMIIANGIDWLASADVRFMHDECCRHNVIDIMGDLALLGTEGNTGLPCGHIVAYNIDHRLTQQFVEKVAESIAAGDLVHMPFLFTPRETEQMQEIGQEEEQAAIDTTLTNIERWDGDDDTRSS